LLKIGLSLKIKLISLVFEDVLLSESSFLILESVPFVLSDLFFEHLSSMFRFIESPVEHLNFLMEIFCNLSFVVKGVACGLEPFDLDIFVLIIDFLPVQLLNNVNLGQVCVVDHGLVLLWGHSCRRSGLFWGGQGVSILSWG